MKKRLSSFLLSLALLLGASSPQALAQQPAYTEADSQAVYGLLYGYLLAESGKYQEAAVLVGEVGMRRQDSRILESAVKIALQAFNLDLAQQYANAWAAAGGGVPARQTQAELYIHRQDFKQAERLLAGLMIDRAQSNEELRQQLQAVADKQLAVQMGRRLFPQDDDGAYNLALLALGNGDIATANEVTRGALAGDRGSLNILFLAARIAQAEEGDAAPLELIRQFVGAKCKGTVRHCTLDGVLWAFGDYLRDGTEWHEGLNVERGDEAAWAVSAGHWYRQWEMPKAARAAYQRGGGLFMAQLGLAYLAEDEGDIAAAMDILRNATVENGEELSRRETTLSYMLSEQGEHDAALERLVAAQKVLPENFSLMYHHSLVLEKKGDINGAVTVLRRITQIFPNNPDGWNALGYVMADNNIALQEAKTHIERALAFKPNDPNIIDSMGWVLYRLGNLAGARVKLQQAAELSQSAEIHAHYGEVLWELGDTNEARRVWRQAQTFDPESEILNETLKRYNPF